MSEPVNEQPEGLSTPISERLSRRTLLGGSFGLAIPALAISRGWPAASAQTEATPVAGSPVPATPALASPEALASPVATPVPNPLGALTLIDDQRPVYSTTPVPGGELRLALAGGKNGNFSPAGFRQDFQIMSSYLDPLVWIDEVTMTPLPWLAKSWTVSKDGLQVRFRLRTDVRWHDGTKLTADDVVFSFSVYRDDVDSAVRNLFTNMERAEADGDDQLLVELNKPDGNWLLNAASQFVIQRDQYVKFWEAQPEGERSLAGFSWDKQTAIGTGPWKIDRFDDESFEFAKFDEYWAGPPSFERLTLTTIDEPSARLAAWKAGEIDVLGPVAFADLPAVNERPGKLYVADTAKVMFAAFNFSNLERADPALLGDPVLRKALSLAINRKRYAEDVFGGFHKWEAAGTVAQPWANAADVKNPNRNLEEAKKLLKEAGYVDADGDGVLESPSGERLSLSIIFRTDTPEPLEAMIKTMGKDLADLGVELIRRRMTIDNFDRTWLIDRAYDLVVFSYSLYPGFTDFDLYGSAWDIRTNPQGWNPGGYSNADVDKALRDFLDAKTHEEQIAPLAELQAITNEDLFGLWFGFPRDLILVQADVQGYQPNKQWQTWNTRSMWRA